jgi:DNA invertase Pin-like site-specific DNA recombinase/DNA-binding CsgD family transcriptional regulator
MINRQRPGSAASRNAKRALGKKQVLGYIRVSSDMQVDEGHSLASQQAMIQEWCRRTLGEGNYDLQIEADEGFSGSLPYAPPRPGSSKYRPGLAAAVTRLQALDVDYLVVYRLNRLFRDHYLQLGFIRDFISGSSCKLIALADNIDLETIQDEMMMNVIGVFADYERKQTSRNVKDAKASRRRDGYPTGHVPYGWRSTPGERGVRPGVAPYPEELQWVRRCFDLALAGRGIREIARELTRLKAPPPGTTGLWEELKVHRLLRQPFHAGLIWDGEGVRQGVHWDHRVLEPEEWERVQDGLASRKRERVPYDGKALRPLYHVGRCGVCGSRLQVLDVDGLVVYRCPGSAYQGLVLPPSLDGEGEADPPFDSLIEASDAMPTPPGEPAGSSDAPGIVGRWCPGWQKTAAHVDEILVQLLCAAVSLPEFTALAHAEARSLLVQEGRETLAQRRGELQRAVTHHQEQLRRLLDLHLENRVPRELYDERYDQLTTRQAELETDLADVVRRLDDQESDEQLLERIQVLLQEFPRLWEALTPDERRQLVKELTEYAVVERTGYRQSRLRVKIHFLPEQSAVLPHGHSLVGGYGAGVAGLTPRELALLYWVGQGKSAVQIAAHWQGDRATIYGLRNRVLKRLQVPTLAAAVALAEERIEAEREQLPLDEPTQQGRHPWIPSQEERIRQVLDGHRRGLDRKAIADETGLAVPSVRHYEWKACKRYGVPTLVEALERFAAEQEEAPKTGPAVEGRMVSTAPQRRRAKKAA